ncbi:MAG: Xaa-Pro peptidase family protein [Anaerolineae bacterium]|nr:Xaa-Pro peptidase family protein [Anaerolineae bacterium]
MLRLTREGCVQRREQLIRAAEADLLVLTNPRSIFYLSGLYVSQLALSGWGLNFLLIDARTGHSRLLVHNFISDDASAAHVDDVDVWTWYDAAENPGVELFGAAAEQLNARLGETGAKRIGVETGWLPVGVNVRQPVDITAELLTMQRQKQADELALIREAVRVVEAGHRAARAAIKPGITELDVYNAAQAAMVNEAGHAIHLMGDFVSGERAAKVSGSPTNKVLQPGSLMIVDMFPIVSGYRADFTATLAIDKQLTEFQQRLETALHAGIEAGETMLKPGSGAGDVYRAVRGALAGYGVAEGFSHHAGHGVGLDHPAAPYLVPNSQETLMAGDVVTLEPGSYGADWGARIERNYLITDDGFERLTHHQTAFV